MNLLYILLVLFLSFFLLFFPGYIFLKKSGWREEEDVLACSFGVSILFFGFLFFSAYFLKLPVHVFSLTAAALVLLLIFLTRKNHQFCFPSSQPAGIFFMFLALCFCIETVVVVQGGGGWANDWWEHYFRSQFFVHRHDLHVNILGLYTIPSRTPLFHWVCGFFLSLTRDSYAVFQVVCVVLSSLFLLPLFSIMKRFLKPVPWKCVAFVVLFNPFLLKMVIYTTPKALTAYFALLSLEFYFRYLDKAQNAAGSGRTLLWCGIWSGCAYLTHSSSLFYMVSLIFHVLFIRKNLKPVFFLLAPFLLISLPWHLWVGQVYGFHSFLHSAPFFSYQSATPLTKQQYWLLQPLLNLEGAFLPAVLVSYVKTTYHDIFMLNPYALLGVYHRVLNFYFGSFPGSLTLSGSVVVLLYVWRNYRKVFSLSSPHRSSLFLFMFSGFMGSLLFVKNEGLPLGMVQNALMPVCALLIVCLAHGGRFLDARAMKVFVLCYVLECFFVLWGHLLFPRIPSFSSYVYAFDQANFSIIESKELVFLHDLLGPFSLFFLFLAAGLQIYVLFKVKAVFPPRTE